MYPFDSKFPERRKAVLKAQTTPDLIADALRRDIQSGGIPPGGPLRQEDLAARFAVSRIPVREALRRLESEGLVTVFPNRGAFVVRLSADEIREITDLRILIEGDLVHRSVPRMDDDAVARVVGAGEVAARTAGTPAWIETDRAFHESLYLPAERPRQLGMAMSLRRTVERYETLYRQLPEDRERWLGDHRMLVEACRRRDAAGARRCLAEHITRAGAFLVERVGDDAGDR